MGSKAIGWRIVKNTTASRMVNSSFIYKLIPSIRLRRRCKAMNVAIRQQHILKTYRQYVTMKTDILRDLTDDEETDVNDNFTETDYNISCKTDSSLTDDKTLTPNKNTDHLSKRELDKTSDKNDTVSHTTKVNAVTKRVKSKIKVKNLGWHDIKSKSKNISNDTNENMLHESSIINQRTDHRDTKSDLEISNTNGNFPACFEKSSLIQDSETPEDNEMCNIEKGAQLNVKVSNPNEVMHDVTKTSQSTNNSEELIEQINKVNERLQSDEDYYCETFNSCEKQTVDGITKHLLPLLGDINKIKDEINTQVVDVTVCPDESHSSSSERNTNYEETCTDEGKSHKFSNIQPLHLNSTNQPKDSGIEEDTEEEVLANKSKNLAKNKNELPKMEENVQTTPSNSFIQSDLSNSNDYLFPEDHIVSDKINSDHRKMVPGKDTHNSEDHRETMQKDKSQPRVTCTETVNDKYKVILRDASFANNCTSSDLNLDFNDKEAFGTQEIVRSIEESVSSSTKKRLQQLRRLNLTVESESSLSESDNSSYNTEIMNSSLFRRSRESPDISDSEDKIVKSKLTMLVQFGKNSEKNKSSRITDRKKENTMQSVTNTEKHTKNNKKRKKRKKSEDLIPTEAYYRSSLSNCIEQTTTRSDHKEYSEAEERNSENQSVGSVMQIFNEQNTAIHDRPYNLQQLINNDGLVPQTMKPSFTFKDICEDDIFILDIPSTAFEKHLLGKKMILNETKLKLGKQKYRIEYQDIGSISCIFGRKKSHKSYKTVNIKPTARIVTREKIIKSSLLKLTNQYNNDERNHIKDDSEIEDKETSTKRHIEMEHKIPFKRKRYSDTRE